MMQNFFTKDIKKQKHQKKHNENMNHISKSPFEQFHSIV